MINAILNQIRQAGGTIEVIGGDLRLKAPAGLLTAADKVVLVEDKDKLILLLAPARAWREHIEELRDLAAEQDLMLMRKELPGGATGRLCFAPLKKQKPARSNLFWYPSEKMACVDDRGDLIRAETFEQALALAIRVTSQAKQKRRRSATAAATPSDPWQAGIEPGAPCSTCGSLKAWQDFGGSWHCMTCEASGLERSRQLIEQASRLRRRGGFDSLVPTAGGPLCQ